MDTFNSYGKLYDETPNCTCGHPVGYHYIQTGPCMKCHCGSYRRPTVAPGEREEATD